MAVFVVVVVAIFTFCSAKIAGPMDSILVDVVFEAC